MKAAVVHEWGHTPVLEDFETPEAGEGEVRVAVTASALTNFTKLRAAGKHYSAATPPPFIPGIDGIGRSEDGRRVYFLFPRAPFGGLAEAAVVPSSRCVPVPDGVDDITLAAIADPGMSSWAALEVRAKLTPGETVLINGATGTAGGLAVQIAKHLGASTVIVTGRRRDALEPLLDHGADEIIELAEGEPLHAALRAAFQRGVDIVLDYLWGGSAESILAAAGAGRADRPMRFIQIGTASARTITVPGDLLHSSAIEIMGSGVGSVHPTAIMGILGRLMNAAPAAGFHVATRAFSLTEVGDAWSVEARTPRVVVTMNR
ncbi:quinone oxidoreductase family protein [Kutzneria sp. CA-103260]|uniref:quinone oxidoreductase family protein n=1 Tax=Kutzneria sp. CA-103260 TaxID=2802641 RepID=UPI001BEE6367|nr:zinc-binding alcohol dehydrogenase family protein [Kutzneria sp. CA-103260]QUQ63003.1 alcohol dehydrogenase [Kutzneria sp. CA-103260]